MVCSISSFKIPSSLMRLLVGGFTQANLNNTVLLDNGYLKSFVAARPPDAEF